jgi:hypothetical protein
MERLCSSTNYPELMLFRSPRPIPCPLEPSFPSNTLASTNRSSTMQKKITLKTAHTPETPHHESLRGSHKRREEGRERPYYQEYRKGRYKRASGKDELCAYAKVSVAHLVLPASHLRDGVGALRCETCIYVVEW